MRSLTRTTRYAALSIIVTCLTMLPCKASRQFDRLIDTGQARELINRPSCGGFDTVEGADLCDYVGR
jgi:hypothetical protein